MPSIQLQELLVMVCSQLTDEQTSAKSGIWLKYFLDKIYEPNILGSNICPYLSLHPKTFILQID
jgi:hypothetical protein